jgi:hypothetical protein
MQRRPVWLAAALFPRALAAFIAGEIDTYAQVKRTVRITAD